MTAVNDLIVGGASGAPARLAAGAAMARLFSVPSAGTQWKVPFAGAGQPANPTYTTSTGAVYMGLAIPVVLTATQRLLMLFSFIVPNVTNTKLFAQITITSAAQSWGAAYSGGACSNSVQVNGVATPCLVGWITGLALNSTYYLDLVCTCDSGGTYGGIAPTNIGWGAIEV